VANILSDENKPVLWITSGDSVLGFSPLKHIPATVLFPTTMNSSACRSVTLACSIKVKILSLDLDQSSQYLMDCFSAIKLMKFTHNFLTNFADR